jgi:hypothetical protein
MDIFIDESGDLGFSPKSSHYFVAAYIIPAETVGVRSSLSKLLKKMHKNQKYSGSELKFSNTSHDTRLWVLNKLMELDWTTGVVILEKKKVNRDLRGRPNILYNYSIVHNVMTRIMMLMGESQSIHLHIDRSLSSSNREAFDSYAREKARLLWDGASGHDSPLMPGQIALSHENSFNDPCIQLADFVAGSVFQKYERRKEEYYRVIEDRVTFSDYLW